MVNLRVKLFQIVKDNRIFAMSPKELALVIAEKVTFNSEGKISDESPVGKALMGHKVGDKVVVEAPRGEMTYKIVKIDIEAK